MASHKNTPLACSPYVDFSESCSGHYVLLNALCNDIIKTIDSWFFDIVNINGAHRISKTSVIDVYSFGIYDDMDIALISS